MFQKQKSLWSAQGSMNIFNYAESQIEPVDEFK